MRRRRIGLCLLLAVAAAMLRAQEPDRTVESRLSEFFRDYTTSYARIGPVKLRSVRLDHGQRTLDIYPDAAFGYQPFTPETVEAIYRSVRQLLPGPVNYYALTIHADGKPIEELVPNVLRKRSDRDKSRMWNNTTDYRGEPWVRNLSRPYEATSGLEGRHVAVHSSHGRYFKNDKGEWAWQRPRLFCTTEDLFTRSFVVPFLIPMLENAGAVVYTSRERDSQPREVIVDNDAGSQGCLYYEDTNRRSRWQTAPGKGFALLRSRYADGENPFEEGTARFAPTAAKKGRTFAEWIPDIPEAGRYAVYVSYRTLPRSVSDARYTVFHKGGATEFSVNQQMGGGTWVYLGTFEFDKGCNDYGMVVLRNESREKGVVCADAVRFGGGMGNIVRGTSAATALPSGLPRCLEGARYQAQWSGMPYAVYGGREGANDYADDINTRSLALNYLAGGSVYNPEEEGLKVPLELSVSLHSDAGFSQEDELIGSLGIYTTDFHDGQLGAGISRYASRDLADMVLTGLQRDLDSFFPAGWARRSLWNRNYSETRLPAVPSMILEMFSHQNFADMKLGHDPRFKFTLARSVYKSILRYTASMHRTDYVVQPLPVSHFAVLPEGGKNQVRLSWQPTEDPLEPTASPKEYIVYTRIGFGGFDNGELVRGTSLVREVEPDMVYSFKVTAVNRGGESFPSEILSACRTRHDRGSVLIVNGFDRLSGPRTVDAEGQQGFDLDGDIGVPYRYTSAYCGRQLGFDRSKAGVETEGGLGYSGSEWEGRLIAGNTFDYVFLHGKAIQSAGGYSFFSCSNEAVESGLVHPETFLVVDLLTGVEEQPFTPAARRWMTRYCRQGGNLLVSGTHIHNAGDADFTAGILQYGSGGSLTDPLADEVMGTGIRFRIHRAPGEESYAIPAPACILPVGTAFSSFLYTDGNAGAGVAYRGTAYRTFALGFPLEGIRSASDRAHVMAGILHFFE